MKPFGSFGHAHGSRNPTFAMPSLPHLIILVIAMLRSTCCTFLGTSHSHDQLSGVWQVTMESHGPWKPVSQGPDQGRNICLRGKQVPDLYVMGTQKSATSSLAYDLMGVGIQSAAGKKHNGRPKKELHWFDHHLHWDAVKSHSLENERGRWLQFMPNCSQSFWRQQNPRRVLADFTPDYMPLVPPPASMHLPNLTISSEHVNLPKMLRLFYGDAAKKVTLVVMLREPLSRMQSAWYAAKACNNFSCICMSCNSSSFQVALADQLTNASRSPPELTSWFWFSMYARQLQQWLTKFAPNQLYVIPFSTYAHGNKDIVCKELSERLGYKIDCTSRSKAGHHSWSNPHPELEKDVSPELRSKFESWIAGENDLLVQLLTRAHQDGAGLANFHGEAGSEADVGAWLRDAW